MDNAQPTLEGIVTQPNPLPLSHHHRPASESELVARVKALESLLVERGYLGVDTVDRIVDVYESEIGPLLGAKVVARAWVDAEFRRRLIADATSACRELEIGGLQGEQLTRMPKGFPVDHPAEALLRHRQWYLEATFDIKLLTTPRVVAEVARHFELMAPFVEFLNRPFANRRPKQNRTMFAIF